MKEDPHTDLVATGKAAVTAIKAEIIEKVYAVFILKFKSETSVCRFRMADI